MRPSNVGLNLTPKPRCRALKSVLGELLLMGVLVYFVAGLVKGTLGVGLPTTAVSLMALIVDARTAVAVVIIPMVVLNAWQIYRQRMLLASVRQFWVFTICLSLSILITSLLAVNISIMQVTLVLGIVVAGYAFVSLWKSVPKLPDKLDTPAQILAGLVSGVIGGIAGLWAPPMMIYLSSKRLSNDQFVGVAGMFLFAGSLFLLFGYIKNGIITQEIAVTSLVLLPISVLGFTLGEHWRKRIDTAQFQKLLLIFFLVAGSNLIYRALQM